MSLIAASIFDLAASLNVVDFLYRCLSWISVSISASYFYLTRAKYAWLARLYSLRVQSAELANPTSQWPSWPFPSFEKDGCQIPLRGAISIHVCLGPAGLPILLENWARLSRCWDHRADNNIVAHLSWWHWEEWYCLSSPLSCPAHFFPAIVILCSLWRRNLIRLC